MWDLPGPGIEPVSPALAGGFLTAAPPGKSKVEHLYKIHLHLFFYELPVHYLLIFFYQISDLLSLSISKSFRVITPASRKYIGNIFS